MKQFILILLVMMAQLSTPILQAQTDTLLMNNKKLSIPSSTRSDAAIARNKNALIAQLASLDLALGSPIFIRIFKQTSILEVWLETKDKQFRRFKEYSICNYSGKLGPKLKEGDQQSPEGFYQVSAAQLNPWSRFHLAFNLGYPNQYDRANQRTGSALMVHGNCVSIGCYAMTDPLIEEIYTLAHAALENGQEHFKVHAFPFPLTNGNLAQYSSNPWYEFWKNLQTGYEWFETNGRPPHVTLKDRHYLFSAEHEKI